MMSRQLLASLLAIGLGAMVLGLAAVSIGQEVQEPPHAQTDQPAGSRKPGPATVTLQLKNMDIVDALRTLAEKGDLNIVAEEGVKGRLTLFLTDVEIMDALDIIVDMNDLAYIKDKHAIKIMTGKRYEDLFGRPFRDRTELKVFALKNAQAALVANQLGQLKTKAGKIIPDPRTNSLIVIDTPDAIAEMRSVISTMDMPVATRSFGLTYASPDAVSAALQPVLTPAGRIEINRRTNTLIVTDTEPSLETAGRLIAEFDTGRSVVTRSFSLRYAAQERLLPIIQAELTQGVGTVYADEQNNQLVVTDMPERIAVIEEIVRTFDKRTLEVLIEAKIMQIALDDATKLGVQWEAITEKLEDLGPVDAKLDFNILDPSDQGARVTSGGLDQKSYEAVLEMLSTTVETNLLSSPRITTVNNETAQILVGSTVPYKTIDTREEDGTIRTFEKVTMVDVGVKLFVTPTINEDGFIAMNIRPEVSSVTGFSDGIPIVEKSETETNVIVKDGVTIIIAGLVREEHSETSNGVPILKDIPVLGIPFRNSEDKVVKSELAIFITPHIITGESPTEIPGDE